MIAMLNCNLCAYNFLKIIYQTNGNSYFTFYISKIAWNPSAKIFSAKQKYSSYFLRLSYIWLNIRLVKFSVEGSLSFLMGSQKHIKIALWMKISFNSSVSSRDTHYDVDSFFFFSCLSASAHLFNYMPEWFLPKHFSFFSNYEFCLKSLNS